MKGIKMKRIYFVKKDPLINSEDNWIQMNKQEYLAFIHTPAAENRFFAQLDACTQDDCIITVETTKEQAVQCRNEKDHHDYLTQNEINSGIQTLSYDESIKDTDAHFSDFSLADQDQNIADQIIEKCDQKTLEKALDSLSDSEYQFIYNLFLSPKRKSEHEMAQDANASQQAINKKKRAILEKIKLFF